MQENFVENIRNNAGESDIKYRFMSNENGSLQP